MAEQKRPRKRQPQNRASNLRAGNLTPDQLIRGIFAIKPDDVKRIVASKPGKGNKPGKGKPKAG